MEYGSRRGARGLFPGDFLDVEEPDMPKPANSVLACLFATGALVLGALPSAAAQSYVMTCRGGGNMVAVAGQRVSQPHVFVEITYKRGSAGAGVQAPNPGECTWIDRGVNGNEPDKILFDDPGVAWTQTVCRAGGCQVNTPSAPTTNLMNWVRGGQAFQVHVYNDGAGHMVVTKVGP
jgi:hypothetical protein